MAESTGAGFRWLRTGDEVFASMLADIEAAQRSIRLEMYIFSDSPIGHKFRDALVRACQRGIRVRVLIDAWGSFLLLGIFWNPLVAAGGEFRWFNTISLHRFGFRNHRKSLVCDEEVAFVGGFNIASEWEGDGITRGWLDYGLRLTGPLAAALAAAFDVSFDRTDLRRQRFARIRKATSHQRISTPDSELLLSGPGRGSSPIKSLLRDDLAEARDVRILCAYFLPPWRLRRNLMRAAERGARVQLILAGKSDVALSQLASRRLYRRLLDSGIQIYEYQPQIHHAKLYIIDDIVYVGSANLDIRSLNINYELLLRIPNERLAGEARANFDKDLAHCRRIDPITWRRSRSFWTKFKERWAYFLLARVDPYVAQRQLRRL